MDLQTTMLVIAKKTNKSIDELKKELDECYNKRGTLFPTETEEQKRRGAISELSAIYRKSLLPSNANSEIFDAFFIGYMENDAVAYSRKIALDEYKRDPNNAVKRGVVDTQGNPLYYAPEDKKRTMKDWQLKQLGTKIPLSDLRKVLFGVVMTQEGIKEIQFTLKGDNMKKKIEFFKNATFSGVRTTNSDEKCIRAYADGSFNPTYKESVPDKQLEQIFNNVLSYKKTSFKDIDQYIESKKPFIDYAIIKAMVVDISPKLTKNNQRTIQIQDDSMDVVSDNGDVLPAIRCFMPIDIPIDFSERVYVYVFGRPSKTEKGILMNIYGIYTPAIYKDNGKSLPVETPPKKDPEPDTPQEDFGASGEDPW